MYTTKPKTKQKPNNQQQQITNSSHCMSHEG